MKIRLYEILVRAFGNTRAVRKIGGSLEENGCGTFADINHAALASLQQLGITHLWLVGVIEHASATAYPDRPADPPELLKGLAGSPFAIRDYFDLCPDLVRGGANKTIEFRALLDRCHAHGLRVIIDFVPNHVARSYGSDVAPEQDFGRDDDTSVFFARDNHFFYVHPGEIAGHPPLRLPTAGIAGCTGLFAPETSFARVTGNNAVTWAPLLTDWYETVKLNYGHDFTQGRDTSHLPGPEASDERVPRTWRTMDAILAHWQALGVDGFRVDMAHLIPIPYWHWQLRRVRQRDAQAFMCAEAYDDDHAKLTDANVVDKLLEAGFDAVYDQPCYRQMQAIVAGSSWANDLIGANAHHARFHRMLRYAENHDEVRMANPDCWSGVGWTVAPAVTAFLGAMGAGPLMLYAGQELGEPAIGAEGFSGDDGRSSIFDYTHLPELLGWTNNHRYDGAALSPRRAARRDWYGRLLRLLGDAAFAEASCYGLNHANLHNPLFGRLGDEPVSGRWLGALLRRNPKGRGGYLVAANFNGHHSLRGIEIHLPGHARDWLGLVPGEPVIGEEMLDGIARAVTGSQGDDEALRIGTLAPGCAAIFRLAPASSSHAG
jgi:glycosidase